jgi:hypothetical protein
MVASGSVKAGHTEAPMTDAEKLEEVVEVLREVASVRAPHRALAVRYTQAREALLAGRLRAFVPTYLLQCVSVFKFHDFINLFAPDTARRIEFIHQTFAACRKGVGFAHRYDVFGDED